MCFCLQFGTLARMLQSAPPPKFVKVTMSKRVPLAGEELIAYEEEQNRLKREEALRVCLVKEEETKASHGSDDNTSDLMVIDTKTTHDGNFLSEIVKYYSAFDLYCLCPITSYFSCKLQLKLKFILKWL